MPEPVGRAASRSCRRCSDNPSARAGSEPMRLADEIAFRISVPRTSRSGQAMRARPGTPGRLLTKFSRRRVFWSIGRRITPNICVPHSAPERTCQNRATGLRAFADVEAVGTLVKSGQWVDIASRRRIPSEFLVVLANEGGVAVRKDDVRTPLEDRHALRQVGWRIEVVVRRPFEEGRAAELDRAVEIGDGAKIALVMYVAKARIAGGKVEADLLCAVARCVVTDDELEVTECLCE